MKRRHIAEKQVKRPNHKAPMIYVGVTEQTVESAKKGLVAILETKAHESALVAACQAFSTVCAVTNTTITHCHFRG